MELRTLGYFVATADAGTISAAAAQVHVTQPSLSRQLRGLERTLGVDLFDRSQRRLVLSAAGRALLPRARALLVDAERLRQEARLHAHGRLERVTIAAPSTTLTDVVSPFLARLRPDDPVPSVVESDGISAEDALRRGRGADLAIAGGRPPAPFMSFELPPLPLWVYLPRDHRWVGQSFVDVATLAHETLLVQPPTHQSRQVLEAALTTRGLWPSRLVEVTNGTVAQALVAAGRGVAVVSDDPRFDLDRVAVCMDPDDGQGEPREQLSVRLHCVWDPGHPAAQTLQSLAERIGAYVVDQYVAPLTTPDRVRGE